MINDSSVRSSRQVLSDLLAQNDNAAVLHFLETMPDEGLGPVVALLLRGVALQQSGRLSDAADAYSQALESAQGDLLTLWNNLAGANYHLGEFAKVVENVEALRPHKPFDCDLLALHVLSLLGLGRKKEALEVAREFADLIPRSAKATRWLMNALGANRCYLEGVLRASVFPLQDWKSSGVGHQLLQWLCELDLCDVADHLFPLLYGNDCNVLDDMEACFTKASIAYSKNDFPEAKALYEGGMARGYSDHSAKMNLSFIELKLGNFGAGWDYYRARTEDKTYRPAVLTERVPRWRGESLTGKTIVVSSEQGIGDMIQLLRFIPRLEALGARVIFASYPDVVGLLGNDPRAKKQNVVPLAVEEIDYFALIMDLPYFLGVKTAHDIPREIPYLFANSEKSAYWGDRLASYAGFKVGVVWAGNPEHSADHCRSASINDFSPLAGMPGVKFFGLQKGAGAKEAQCPPEGLDYVWLGNQLASFEDTAAVIDNLDLVISVDTSVVHLAAALGKEVWLIDALRSPEWRWVDFGEGNTWYPNVVVFRQEVVDDWTGLLRNRVRPELARRLLNETRLSKAHETMLRVDARELGWDEVDWSDWSLAFPENQLPEVVLAWLGRMSAERDIALPLQALSSSCGRGDTGNTGSPRLRALRARQEIRRGDASKALDWLEAIVLTHGDEVLGRADFAEWGWRYYINGDFKRAVDLWQRAVEAFPRDGHLHYLLGLAWSGLEEPDKALECHRRALERFPRHFKAYLALAGLLRVKKPVEAWEAAQKAVLLKATDVEAWNFIVSLLHDRGMYWLAEGILRSKGDIWNNFSSKMLYLRQLLMQGREHEWRALFDGIQFDHRLSASEQEGYIAFAFSAGLADKAFPLLENYLLRHPESRVQRFSLGFNQLRFGLQKEGWRNYWLGMRRDVTKHFPEWQGENLSGKTLLIVQDQGQGDLIQFFPLLDEVWQRSPRRMVVAVSPALVTLFRAQTPPFEVVNAEKLDWEDYCFDYQVEYMALPYLLAVDLLHPRHKQPTLVGLTDWGGPWRDRLQSDQNLKVGIVWSGGDLFKANYVRSTSLTDWEALWEIDGISFYSLQKDLHSNQAAVFDRPLHNLAADCPTWLETLAAIESLDLVITTCTAVAHLAGSINKPVWIILSNEYVDYRWQQDRDDVPWYPSARLFRRQFGESWPQVFVRVGRALLETYPNLRCEAEIP